MARSAKRRKPDRMSFLREGAMSLGAAISRNPVLVGSTTAFLVALSFVSANALWYQPALPRGRVFPDPRSGRHLYRAESGTRWSGRRSDRDHDPDSEGRGHACSTAEI